MIAMMMKNDEFKLFLSQKKIIAKIQSLFTCVEQTNTNTNTKTNAQMCLSIFVQFLVREKKKKVSITQDQNDGHHYRLFVCLSK